MNPCKKVVDEVSASNQKLCKWKASGPVICDINDQTELCAGNHCSNANTDLARYAMCPSSPNCGSKTLFLEQGDITGKVITANFTSTEQLCVYQVIFSDVGLYDSISVAAIQVESLSNVKAQLFSRVEVNNFNKYVHEFDIEEEITYLEAITNEDDQAGADIVFYIVIEP